MTEFIKFLTPSPAGYTEAWAVKTLNYTWFVRVKRVSCEFDDERPQANDHTIVCQLPGSPRTANFVVLKDGTDEPLTPVERAVGEIWKTFSFPEEEKDLKELIKRVTEDQPDTLVKCTINVEKHRFDLKEENFDSKESSVPGM